MQPGNKLTQIDDPARYYAFLIKTDVDDSNAVITGTIYICDQMSSVIFDLRSTYPDVSVQYATGLNLDCDVLVTLFICLL